MGVLEWSLIKTDTTPSLHSYLLMMFLSINTIAVFLASLQRNGVGAVCVCVGGGGGGGGKKPILAKILQWAIWSLFLFIFTKPFFFGCSRIVQIIQLCLLFGRQPFNFWVKNSIQYLNKFYKIRRPSLCVCWCLFVFFWGRTSETLHQVHICEWLKIVIRNFVLFGLLFQSAYGIWVKLLTSFLQEQVGWIRFCMKANNLVLWAIFVVIHSSRQARIFITKPKCRHIVV